MIIFSFTKAHYQSYEHILLLRIFHYDISTSSLVTLPSTPPTKLMKDSLKSQRADYDVSQVLKEALIVLFSK